VQEGDINVSVSSLGSVTPVYTATISPRVDGEVIAVNYTEGQMVESNDLLVVIDPKPFEAALTQATGQLTRDQALLEGAMVDLSRYQTAYEKRAVPKQQVDDQIALVHQDEGTVKLDQGNVDSAQVQLNYCYVRAPFSGRVGLRLVDPGNVVHAAETNAMVVVTELQPITVIFNVAEDYLPQIEAQMQTRHSTNAPSIDVNSGDEIQPSAPAPHPMVVEAWDRADENKLTTGKVLAINNMIDSSTGTIRIRAVFDNGDLALFPNQFVNAKLIIQTLHHTPLVPTYAIQHNPDGAFLYVATNIPNTTNMAVTMRNITPGVVDGNTTSVAQGLEAGEKIALDNFNKLGEGVKINPHEQAAGPGGKSKKGGHRKKKPAADSSDTKSEDTKDTGS
jgi:multidrug efflux system membrane fusion protein